MPRTQIRIECYHYMIPNSLICDTSIQVQIVIFNVMMVFSVFIELLSLNICDPLSHVASAVESWKPTFPGDLRKIDIFIIF